jgi:hypothetical protein
MVGIGDVRRVSGRKVFAIGCPNGIWPPVCKPGTVESAGTDSRGAVIVSSQTIIGGQSGGALFDADTGYLLGVTNWGSGRKTHSLYSSSWADTLTKEIGKFAE